MPKKFWPAEDYWLLKVSTLKVNDLLWTGKISTYATWLVNSEWIRRILKKAVMALSEVLPKHLHGGNEKSHTINPSEWLVSVSRFEHSVHTSNLWSFLTWFLVMEMWHDITSLIYMVASECSQNHLISETYKEYSHWSYNSFKIVPLCNYTLLPETIKVLEHSWKPTGWSFFSPSVTSLAISVASPKCHLFNANFIGGNR